VKKRIFKYSLEVEPRQMLHLPAGAELLSVIADALGPKLYALVDPEAPAEPRILRTVVAGEVVEGDALGAYVGTYVVGEGRFIGHLFEQAVGVGDERDRRWDADMADLRRELVAS
jgi:hypothetical protein